MMRRD